jgi:glycosyltransferase involved in cell wall biosynthesis
MNPDDEYILLFNDESLRERTIEETGLGDAANVRGVLVPCGPFSPRGQWALPALWSSAGVDVFHSTNYMIPLLRLPGTRRVPVVVTVHDVIPLLFRDHAPRSKKSRMFPLYRRLMIEIGRRADRIITVSRASMQDLVREMRVPNPAGVRVIHNGVSDLFLRTEPHGDRPVRRNPTVLYVGRMDPYKNLQMLIRAVDVLRREHRIPADLVVVGPPDPRYPEPLTLARNLGLAGCVRWTGYLSSDSLVAAYRDADVLAHPSRYEGFGLQVLEAMAVGLPVVCTNAGALPEITDKAAIRTSPDDMPGFAAALARVLSQPALARSMAETGRRHAAGFTWQRAAAATINVYREFAADGVAA